MKKTNLLFSIITFIFCIFLMASCNASSPDGSYKDNQGPSMNPSDDILIGDNYGEEYNHISENPFYNTTYEASSYFSMDSFTASYSNLRRYINNSYSLPADVIKTDELINYFKYDLEKPEEGEVFNVSSEMSVAPWNTEHKILTIGVTSKEEELAQSSGNNIVFLIDSSGSMNTANKMGLLKEAFSMLIDTLSDVDRISIVTYANGVKVVADGIYGDNKYDLKFAINNLKASGGTNGSGGIQKAYEIAQKHFIPGGNNRVILATDGDFNIGISNQNDLQALIKEKASTGVYLTCLGFGMGNYKDTTMETLAKNGNGGYAYLDNILEAKKVLVDEINSTLVTVAKDVKNKVAFNPAVVESYRLIGYENKQLSKDEFEDPTVDAGEVGSGHTTLVTYEIVLKDDAPILDKAFDVQINYKDPKSNESKTYQEGFNLFSLDKEPSEDHKFAVCLVEFSLILRNSRYRGTASYDTLIERLETLESVKTDEFRKEFVSLVKLAKSKNLIAYPSVDESKVTIKICTDYGFNQFQCSKGTYVDNAYILGLIFGSKIPTDKVYEIAYDEDYVKQFTSLYADSNFTIYIREVTY